MTKKNWWKKDVLWFEQTLKNYLDQKVCKCWSVEVEVSQPSQIIKKQFCYQTRYFALKENELDFCLGGCVYISVWEDQQIPTFDVLVSKWEEQKEIIQNKINRDIKCFGFCKV